MARYDRRTFLLAGGTLAASAGGWGVYPLQSSRAEGLPSVTGSTVPRDLKAGIYVIWYPHDERADTYLGQPYVRGGQIVLQWAEVEPEPGRYVFDRIGDDLADFARRGQYTTLQINGNRKPAWLYERVPYLNERLSVQINDPVTLMYWHPAHRDAYLAMIRELGKYLDGTAHGDRLLGIRMNFNALGTEHHHVPKEYARADRWTFPAVCDRADAVDWTKEVDEDYLTAVVDTYVDTFRQRARIFVRNTISDSLEAKYRRLFENGTLSWFHTSSEVEPRAGWAEKKYLRFYRDCRSGKTTAYAEPWASAWGHHGGQTDSRWCSPAQWFYWRILFDLHCGVSYLALYATDLRVAIDGTYAAGGVHVEDAALQREFQAAVRFAEKYVGYHADPAHSPGAWVAFRENDVVRAENGISEEARRLEMFTGNYDFLARTVADAASGVRAFNQGPDSERFGAFAKTFRAGETVRVEIDRRFVQSLSDSAALNVVVLDTPGLNLALRCGGKLFSIRGKGTGRWMRSRWTIAASDLQRAKGIVEAVPQGNTATLHMIEVERG
ncbi:hypothetical protein JCM19992_10730 [Thermostilla marina]